MIGRDAEVARARTGLRAGRVVVLAGPAGIGKSTVGRAVAIAERLGTAAATVSLAALPRGALLAALESVPAPAGPADSEPVALAVALRIQFPQGLLLDDVQWLDEASVPVLQIAVRRGLRLLLTCRSSVPLSAAVAELLGAAERVDIGPLPAEQLVALLEQQLGAPLDGAVAGWFTRMSDGNPLLAHNLAAAVDSAGALTRRHGLLTADGALPLGGSVAEAARERLAAAPEPVRQLVGLLSLEEPLGLGLLREVSSLDAADTGERLGLVAVRGEPAQVWLGHPVYGEVAALDSTGAERVRGYELLAAAAARDDGVDLVRRTRWARAAGHSVAPDQLLAAARSASPPLAEQFLRAALDAGAGLPATLALAGLLGHMHRGEEAVALLAQTVAATPEAEVLLAVTRAFALTFGPQRPQDALDLLAAAERRVGPDPRFEVARSSAYFRAGEINRALALARPLYAQPLPDAARCQVGLTLQTCLLERGEVRDARALIPELAGLTRVASAELPEGAGAAALLATMVERIDGDLAGERERAAAGYAAALDSGDVGLRGQFAQVLGFNRLAAGRARTACRLLQESLAGRGVWLETTRPWVLALLVQAQVVAGELAAARQNVEELSGLHRTPMHDSDVAMAQAAVLAASGERPRAVGLLVAVGRQGCESGVVVRGLECWHDAVRLGSPEAASLLGQHVRHLHTGWAAAYESRVVARTGSDLEETARQWTAIGHVWFAAEALTRAVRLHRARGADRERLRAQLALRAVLVGTEPMAGIGADDTGLTDRESDVVGLAVAGLTDREIAGRLGISVRTVQTHLTHSYAKLGVRSRRDLRP